WCGAVLTVPSEQSVQRAPSNTGLAPRGPKLEAPAGTKFKLSDLKVRPPSGEGKARRRYRRRVTHGLALHYVAPFTFWGGTVVGVLACILALNASLYEWDETAEAAVFAFQVSGVLLLLSGALALYSTIVCSLGGAAVGRSFLTA